MRKTLIRKIVWLWAAALILFSACAAQAAIKFPPLTGHVVDDAHLLTPEIKNQLEQQLAAHERATANQVIIATVPDLQGYPIEDFGYQLGRAWGVGQKGKSNGVILLIAQKDRKIRIEVGYGLEGVITDALSNQIIYNHIAPAFKQNNYAAGIIQGTNAIIAALGGQYAAQKSVDRRSKKMPLWVWIFFLPLLFLNRRRGLSGGYPGGVLGAGILGGGLGGFGGGGFGGGGGFSGGGGGFGGGGGSGGW